MDSVGRECFPKEGLYFRQDMPRNDHLLRCKKERCFHVPIGATDYCDVHIKIFREEGMKLLTIINNKLANKWDRFMETIRKKSCESD